MVQGWICRQGMKESRVWWEECGAGLDMQTRQKEGRVWWEECGPGLDMQTGYKGEQGVVGRVWSRAGYANRI